MKSRLLVALATFSISACSGASRPAGGSGGSGGAAATGGKGGRGGAGGSGTTAGTGGTSSGGAGGSGTSSGGAGGSATGGSGSGGSGGAGNTAGSGGSAATDGAAAEAPTTPPSDGAAPEAGTPDPGTGETYQATALSPGKGQRTDRRPIPVGFYDATVNKTFVSWMGPGSDALVREYDHAAKMWTPDKIVGNSPFTDKHNYPAMIKGKDGRLYVFYGCHNSPLRMAVSPDPLSSAGTWRDGNVSAAPDATYPAPIITSDGTVYVFIRLTRQNNGHSDDRPFAFIKSTDNGQTWTRRTVLDNYPRSDNLTEIYNGKVTYQPAMGDRKARIHLAWTIAGGGPGSHEHDAYTRNIYYAYLDTSNDTLYDITGRDLGTSVDNAEAEMYAKVQDTGCSNCAHQTGYQISVSYNDEGSPLILYGHYQNGLTAIRRVGTSWMIKVVTPQTGEPRDINRIGANAFQVFRTTGNTCVVHRSNDGGDTWRLETTITAAHPVGRCHVIENYHPDVKLFLEENVDGGDTSTAKVTAGFTPPYR